KFRTITDALREAKAGQTVRVLDSATYQEALTLTSAAGHDDLVLEAPRGAVIEVAEKGGVAIHLHNVSGVTLRGIRLRGFGGQTALVLVEGVGPGVLLEDLELRLPVRRLREGELLIGVTVEHHQIDAGAPLVVRRCRFQGGLASVQIFPRDGEC